MAVGKACEKVACMAVAVQTVPAAPAAGGRRELCVRGGPDAMARRLALSQT
jgi:hypothetical protein